MSAKKKTGPAKAKPKSSKVATKVVRKKVAKQPKPRKTEKISEEKVEEVEKIEKPDKPAEVRKVTPRRSVPFPAVNVRHDASMKVRRARGYSVGEITSAGISLVSASRWRVPFDKRRKSLLSENAEKLKAWLQSSKEGGGATPGRKVRTRKKE